VVITIRQPTLLFFARYFDHIEKNFQGMLFLVAMFGQLSQKVPHLTSSVVTKHEAFHHIQKQPAAQ